MQRARFAIAALLLTAGPVLGGTPLLPAAHAPAPIYGIAKPIPAWVTFCAERPAECAYGAAEPTRIVLDAATWAKVVSVNRAVNKAVRPVEDLPHWGVADRWDLAEDGTGDCEDYALLKRHRLAAMGIPRRAMRMTVVINELNEGHAVLTLLTDRGDLVLDNRNAGILPWSETGYRFVKRERVDGPGWISLRPIPASPQDVPVATLPPAAR